MKNPENVEFTTKAAMARALGYDRGTVTDWTAKRDFPGSRKGPWMLPAVVKWLVARTQADALGEDAMLAAAPDSPALERWREAKASQAEIDLAERQRDVLPREKAHAALGRLAGLLRRLGERLGKEFGKDATTMMNGTLDQFQAMVDRDFGPSEAKP